MCYIIKTYHDHHHTCLRRKLHVSEKANGCRGLKAKSPLFQLGKCTSPPLQTYRCRSIIDQQLTQCLAEGDLKGFQELRPATYTDEKSSCQANGNNVEIDRELLQLNENAVKHQFLLKVAEENVRMIRSAITGNAF